MIGSIKHFKDDELMKSVNEAIKIAEGRSTGEIVPVMLRESSEYESSQFKLGIVLVFIGIFFVEWTNFPVWVSTTSLTGFSILMFLIGHFTGKVSFFKRLLTPKDKFASRVHQQAYRCFLEHNLHTTKGRNGILILVSLLERRVEIMADEGIHKKVEPHQWIKIINEFVDHVKADEIKEGFEYAINACGDLLNKHYPIVQGEEKHNELPDQLNI